MAKIYELTKSSRGKAICSKCGKEIIVGEKYNKATPFRRSPIIRCIKCGIKSYETSGSSYIRTVGNLKANWKQRYAIDEDIVDNIMSDIKDIKDEVENSLYNLPEQFQDGNILQDRLDELNDCIDELELIDTSFYDDIDEDDEDFDVSELKFNERELESEISSALGCLSLR